jgi:hypothetical protein
MVRGRRPWGDFHFVDQPKSVAADERSAESTPALGTACSSAAV